MYMTCYNKAVTVKTENRQTLYDGFAVIECPDSQGKTGNIAGYIILPPWLKANLGESCNSLMPVSK